HSIKPSHYIRVLTTYNKCVNSYVISRTIFREQTQTSFLESTYFYLKNTLKQLSHSGADPRGRGGTWESCPSQKHYRSHKNFSHLTSKTLINLMIVYYKCISLHWYCSHYYRMYIK